MGTDKAMDCSKHHRLILEDRIETLVRVGVGWSCLWELSHMEATRQSRGAMGAWPLEVNYLGKTRKGPVIMVIPRGDAVPRSAPSLHWS